MVNERNFLSLLICRDDLALVAVGPRQLWAHSTVKWTYWSRSVL